MKWFSRDKQLRLKGLSGICLMVLLTAIILVSLNMAQALAGGLGSYDYRGQAEPGVRGIAGDEDLSSKFNEYRDIEEGVYLDSLELYLDSEERNHYYELRLKEITGDDRKISLSLGRRGTYRLKIEWDEIPHVFSNQARTLFTTNGAELIISNSIQADVRADEKTLSAHLQEARPIELGVKRKKLTTSMTYNPTTQAQISVRYWLEDRDGTAPVRTTRFFQDMITLPAPIDYRTHNLEVKTEYAAEAYQFQLGYDLSVFDNRHDALSWDNIFSDVDTVGDSSRGRLALFPDNAAQSISFNAAYSPPFYSTRFLGSFSYSWWTQDEDFLPYTINPAITTRALPASSLNGEMNPLLLNLKVVTSPARNLTMKAGYRLYDLNNRAKSHVWEYVTTDALILFKNSRINLPMEYRKQNADLSAAYRFGGKLTTTLFYEWEGWDRKYRETKKTSENTYGIKLDIKPYKRILLRASYAHSLRGFDQYSTARSVEASFTEDPLLGFPKVLPGQRKFEQAERDRDKARVLLQISPTEILSFSVFYDLNKDDYRRSAYGLLHEQEDATGIDFNLTPHDRVSLWGNYTYERRKYYMKSRLRIAGLSLTDIPLNDWTSRTKDRVDTYMLGAEAWLVKDKFKMELSYTNSFGRGRTDNRALGDPAEPFFLVSVPMAQPELKNRLQELETYLRYNILKNLSAEVRYIFEKYDETDFQAAGLAALFPAGITNMVTLNEIIGDYEAHIFSASLNYKF